MKIIFYFTKEKTFAINRGLKYDSAPVGPSMNLDTSTTILTANAEWKQNSKTRMNTRQLLSSKAGNSLKCGSKLIDQGLNLLSNKNWYSMCKL